MPEVNEIVFEDDTFTADPKRAKEISEVITKNGARLPFFANIRTNTNYETLAAFKQSGLRECATGFEAGDKALLVNMRKGQTVEQQLRLMKNCRDLGILVHGCFMVGFPGETHQTMNKTFKLALQLDPDSVQFYPVMPNPGTGAYQWTEDNQHLATQHFEEWLTDDGGHRCVLNLPGFSPNRIEKFCERAFVRFHFRPKYMLRKLRQAIVQPREGIRSVGDALKEPLYWKSSLVRRPEYVFLNGDGRHALWVAWDHERCLSTHALIVAGNGVCQRDGRQGFIDGAAHHRSSRDVVSR